MYSMWYMKQGSHRNVSRVHLFLHQTSLAKGAHEHTKQRHCLVIKKISALKLRKVKFFRGISILKVGYKKCRPVDLLGETLAHLTLTFFSPSALFLWISHISLGRSLSQSLLLPPGPSCWRTVSGRHQIQSDLLQNGGWVPEEPGPRVGECCVSTKRGKEGGMEGKGCGTAWQGIAGVLSLMGDWLCVPCSSQARISRQWSSWKKKKKKKGPNRWAVPEQFSNSWTRQFSNKYTLVLSW